MITYYATFAGLLMAVMISSKRWSVHEALYWPVIAGLFAFSGYRFAVGCDWSGYYINYINVARFAGDFSFGFRDIIALNDAGHWGVITLLHKWGLPYGYLNVFSSGVFFVGLHMFARRQFHPLAVLALAFPILIVNMPMSAIRQGIGIGFMMMAYLAFIDTKVIRFVGFIVLGSLFHSSIVVFLLLTPFIFGKMSFRNVGICLLLALPGLFLLGGSDAADLASTRYIETEIDAAGALFRVGFLVLTALFFQFYLKEGWKQVSPQDYKLVLIGSWLMLGCGALLLVSSVIADRYAYYLIPIQILIFIKAGYLVTSQRRLVSLAPYAGVIAIFIVWTQFSSLFAVCYTPYQNWLL